MVEVSLRKLNSWNYLQIIVTGTYWHVWKVNPTLVQVHLMTWCLYYTVVYRTVVADPSAISWGGIGNRLAIGRRLVGDCILSVCLWLQKVCNFLEIGRQPIGDWSAISLLLKTVSGLSATAAIGRRSVANQLVWTAFLAIKILKLFSILLLIQYILYIYIYSIYM